MIKKVTALTLLFFPGHFYPYPLFLFKLLLSFFPQLPTLFPFNVIPTISLFLPPTPNPLLNAFKPIPLRWVGLFLFSFAFFFLSFLPPTPNPLPSGKRALRFASPASNLHHFFFSLIDMSLFKDRVFAMGKPHCNFSI